MEHPYEQYRAMAVETASPAELVLKLYQGVLRFTQRAMEAVERGDLEVAHASFVRSQSIVAELTASLDMELGGDVAPNLLALYQYAYSMLLVSNCTKDKKPAEQVISLFRELLDAWRHVSQTEPREAASAGATVPAGMR